MKSEKSKVLEPEKVSKEPNFLQKISARFKKDTKEQKTEAKHGKTQKQKDAEANKKLLRQARLKKISGAIGQFFVILFILAVILSMIAIPLLLVFG